MSIPDIFLTILAGVVVIGMVAVFTHATLVFNSHKFGTEPNYTALARLRFTTYGSGIVALIVSITFALYLIFFR